MFASNCVKWMVLLSTGVALMITGCDKPKIVEEGKSPEDVIVSSRERQTPTRQTRSNSRRDPKSKPPPPAPVRTPRPTPEPEELSVDAITMTASSGTSDTEGGWRLDTNGRLQTTSITLHFDVGEVHIEAKGQNAGTIWPEVLFVMQNLQTRKNYTPWRTSWNARNYVTTTSMFTYIQPVQPPIPKGNYSLDFRYYNDTPTPPGTDRHVTLKRITFYP